jgi:conjugal transfer pilus assembly protein TraK
MQKVMLSVILTTALSSPFCAHALQVLDGAEGKKHLVRVPARELTRIAIENGRLAGFKYRKDELEVQQDKDAGSVYVSPLATEKQISVFVISASGATHELILQPVDTLPLESIVIRDPAPKRNAAALANSKIERASSFDQAVKQLMVSMARDERDQSEAAFESFDKPLALWQQTDFRHVGRYSSTTLVGDVYTLTNRSTSVMKLAEQEFYKSGVAAVALEEQLLRPGDFTKVFVVRVTRNE